MIKEVNVTFQTTLISVDNLAKAIHQAQLTEEFDGTLPYNHEEWIDLRLVSTAYKNITW